MTIREPVCKVRARSSMTAAQESSSATAHYPIFVSLAGRVCLVVGGGSVAQRKIKGLLDHRADVRVIAQELSPWIQARCEQGQLVWLGEQYREEHLDQADLVFVATSDGELNRAIARHAEKRRIWCNMASEPRLGSFFVPAVMQQGPLCIAVSTSGLSPALASEIRNRISQQFGIEWASTVILLGLLRQLIQTKCWSTQQNQWFFKEIAKLPLPEWIAARRRDQILESIQGICQPWLSRQELERAVEQIW